MHAESGDLSANRQLLLAQRLRERRRALGLTQKQVVSRLARLGLGTTNKALSSLEHGAGLDVAKLPELALALDCTVTYLLGLTADPQQWDPDAARAEPGRHPNHPNHPESPTPARHGQSGSLGDQDHQNDQNDQDHRSDHGSWILGPNVPIVSPGAFRADRNRARG